MPRGAPFAGNPAVAFAGVKMPEHALRGADRAADVVLFDIHMEGVEHDLDGRHIDFAHERHSLGGGVEQIPLEAVQDLETVIHAAIAGDPADFADVCDAAGPVSGLVDRPGVIDRPVAVNAAADGVDIEDLKFPEQIDIELFRAGSHGRIGAGEVLRGVRAVSGSQENAVVGGAFPEVGEF